MKEIYTIVINNTPKKRQQYFLFYNQKNLNDFCKLFNEKNKETILFIRQDKSLFVLIDYITENSFIKGQELIIEFSKITKTEITNNKYKRNKGLKYNGDTKKQQQL